MVKVIRIVCIAGILALLVLFFLLTGTGRPSTNNEYDSSPKHQTDRNSHKGHKSIDSNTQNGSDILEIIIPW